MGWKNKGRIFEGPKGGQWTAAKRPQVESLNQEIENCWGRRRRRKKKKGR